MASEPFGVCCDIKPSSELNQLLQLGIIVSSCKYEHNNATRHNGLELIRIWVIRWSWWSLPIYQPDKSVHVPPSYNRRAWRYEFEHCNVTFKSETTFIRFFKPLLNTIIIYIASLSLELRWTFGMSVCWGDGLCLRQRSRGHVINSNVLTFSSIK